MRTSLLETREIDNHLLKKGDGANRIVFEAKTLLEPDLAIRVEDQKTTYAYIREYRRQELREEIAEIDRKIFKETRHRGFRQKILSYFK